MQEIQFDISCKDGLQALFEDGQSKTDCFLSQIQAAEVHQESFLQPRGWVDVPFTWFISDREREVLKNWQIYIHGKIITCLLRLDRFDCPMVCLEAVADDPATCHQPRDNYQDSNNQSGGAKDFR